MQDELPAHGVEDQFSKSGYANRYDRSKLQFGEHGFVPVAGEPFDYNASTLTGSLEQEHEHHPTKTPTGMSRCHQLLMRSGARHDGDMRGQPLGGEPKPAYFGLAETTRPGLYTPRKVAARVRKAQQPYAADAAELKETAGPAPLLTSRGGGASNSGSARRERDGDIAAVRALAVY